MVSHFSIGILAYCDSHLLNLYRDCLANRALSVLFAIESHRKALAMNLNGKPAAPD